ncbi:MAG: hypothetical protein WDM70_06465 [Nitrosomonadales bacterium]
MEKSDVLDDWRELIRLYMVRRTRSFILEHYTEQDEKTGRRYLKVRTGEKLYFPTRKPISLGFAVDENDPRRPIRQTVLGGSGGRHQPPASFSLRLG